VAAPIVREQSGGHVDRPDMEPLSRHRLGDRAQAGASEEAPASARCDHRARTEKPQRRRVQVVEVGMGDQNSVGFPELLGRRKRDDPAQMCYAPPQHRIRQQAGSAGLYLDGRVADVGDADHAASQPLTPVLLVSAVRAPRYATPVRTTRTVRPAPLRGGTRRATVVSGREAVPRRRRRKQMVMVVDGLIIYALTVYGFGEE
jgi:hypothetical protein